MARHQLTDQQWECIESFFKQRAKTGRPPADPRGVMDAILWIVRTGAPWRDLPEEFGPWQTVYHHFNQWSSQGKLSQILRHLKQAMSDSESFDHELWCLDGTVVRAARCAAGGWKKSDPQEPADHALGRSRGGFSTKIHLVCDGLGNPLHFELTAGQAHETTAFIDSLRHTDVRACQSQVRVSPVALAGDKAYRAKWIIEWLEQCGIQSVIPEKGERADDEMNPDFDRELYRRRNVVERLVGWLKECRRVFSRFEKTAVNFAGMIKAAIIQRYLRMFCPDEFSDKA